MYLVLRKAIHRLNIMSQIDFLLMYLNCTIHLTCYNGVLTVFSKDYGTERVFQLYNEYEILSILEGLGMKPVPSDSVNQLCGLIFFVDPKHATHCVFYMRKL